MFWWGLGLGLIIGLVLGAVITCKVYSYTFQYLGEHPEEMDKLVSTEMQQAMLRMQHAAEEAFEKHTTNPFS